MPSAHTATLEAERYLLEHNITTLPIDPFALAKQCDITVQAKPIHVKGVSGMLIRHDNQFAIAYATHIKSKGFQRFSVSHELGHYLLPGHIEAVLNNNIHESHAGFVSVDSYEREADSFATGLLMPSTLFCQELDCIGKGLDAIKALACKCITSLTATAIRYVELTDTPTAVIQSSGDRIEWCFMSDELQEIPRLDWLRKNTPLHKNTATYTFNKNPSNVTSALRRDSTGNIQDWFNGSFDIEVIEEVQGLGLYDRTLTVLTVENLDIEELQENKELEESWTPRFRR